MSPEEIQMHLAAGRYYGLQSTCGKKVKHPDETSAVKHANSLNRRVSKNHDVEAYPCYWGSSSGIHWHVGRKMDQHERDLFSSDAGSKLLEMEEITVNADSGVHGCDGCCFEGGK